MLFERRVVYETWELLEDIAPSIAMHWVWGGKSGRQGGPLSQAQTSFRRPINSTNDFHPDVGHLVCETSPTSQDPCLTPVVCASFPRRLRTCLVRILRRVPPHATATHDIDIASDLARFLLSRYELKRSRL